MADRLTLIKQLPDSGQLCVGDFRHVRLVRIRQCLVWDNFALVAIIGSKKFISDVETIQSAPTTP